MSNAHNEEITSALLFLQIKRTRNGITEEVARVHYPVAPCPPKLKCLHCPRTFAREQGRALHCHTVHPTPHWKTGEGLKRGVLTGGTITTPPWQGYSRRCFVVRFHHTTGGGYCSAEGEARFHVPGTCTFELQARIQGDSTLGMPTDGLESDEEGPAPAKSKKTRGADQRVSYTNRKRAAVVAELRELESDNADRIWRVYGVSCRSSWQERLELLNPTSVSGNRMRPSTSRQPVMTSRMACSRRARKGDGFETQSTLCIPS